MRKNAEALVELEKTAEKALAANDFVTAQPLCEKIIRQNPRQHKALYALGVIESQKGNHIKARQLFMQALEVVPGNQDYNRSLGILFFKQQDFDNAVKYLSVAVKISPQNAELQNSLGFALLQKNEFLKAADCFLNAVLLEPANHYYQLCFTECIINCKVDAFNEGLKQGLIICLKNANIAHKALIMNWVITFLNDPAFACLKPFYKIKTFEEFSGQFDFQAVQSCLSDDLFCWGLRRITFRSPEIENFAVHLRHYLLNQTQNRDFSLSEDILYFVQCLSIQCWLNEYVYYETREEKELVTNLQKDIEGNFNSDPVSLFKLFMFSCYRPLKQLKSRNAILKTLKAHEKPLIHEIAVSQLEEPLEEEKIKKTIKAITPIEDSVSRKVQLQYEENPYPRWNTINATHTNVQDSRKIDILIAGCGTGSQSISNVPYYPNANEILNVDLSLSSLAYAIRKSRQLVKTDNLTFAQADILKLEVLDRQFDVIFCSGVLHHMKDPVAGLKVLKKMLKPDGKMNIGLYSEIARQYLAPARDFIREKGYESTPDGIRTFRREVMTLPPDDPRYAAAVAGDFYSTSSCRDLLFHVQEHRFTLPQLKKILEEQSLSFAGFSQRSKVAGYLYKKRFPDDPAMLNLDNWDIFEKENTDAFRGMYQFWVVHKNR